MGNTNQKIKIAVLLDNTFENDSRVNMECSTLAAHYDVTLFCIKAPHLPDEETISGIKVKRVFLAETIYKYGTKKSFKNFAQRLLNEGYSIIHCNDHLMLEIGVHAKKLNPKIKLVYDSHELFYSWPLDTRGISTINKVKAYAVRKLRIREEKQNSRYIDALITVNHSLANILKKYFGLTFEPVVLRNFLVYQPLKSGEHILRKKFNVPDNKKILVFIGMKVFPHVLNLEAIIDQFATDAGICLIFICNQDSNQKYFEEYVNSKGIKNVFFNPIIPQKDILKYLADCDAGLVPTWNKKDLSYWYALDNKLFNYVSAGIPVLATAQPEYKAIVELYKVGVCVNPDLSPTAYHEGMEEIIRNYSTYKENVMKAREELKWENESKKLLDLYARLAGK